MPGLSQRAAAMPASPIRKLAPFAEAAAKRGVKIFHLNIGQPDVRTPDEFWEAVRRPDLTVLEYSHSAGPVALREGIAAAYRDMGLDVKDDEVIVTTAGSEALSFAIGSVCDAGDEVIVPEPMYANYIGFAAGMGVKVVPITTRIEDGFALPSVDEFAKRITPRTKAVVVCNPNNPTGTVYSDDQLEGLRKLALAHNIFIIADEVYREFNYLGGRPKSVLELEGLEQHAVMVDSVSKRYSLCGARVGFIVSRNKDLMSAALRFAQARLSPPTLECLGVIGALRTPASYLEEVRTEYQKRRDVVVRRINAIPGALCPRIDGAFYATVRLPIDDCDKFCQWLLESFDHNGKTVMFAPATGFYATPGLGKDEVRIAYVLNTDAMEEAMDCLEAGLAAYPGRKSLAGV